MTTTATSHRNSVGFLRLFFALCVVFSHSFPLGGYGVDPGRPDNNMGIVAVEGFFALSGLLITASASRLPLIRFLWNRSLRILPAFWAGLVVVAVAAQVVAPLTGSRATDAWGFVWKNLALATFQGTIGTTLQDNPLASYWNGPLYTLWMEFACYLLVGGLALVGLLRPRVVLAIAVTVWVALQSIDRFTTLDDRQARFTLAFLVGSCLWFYLRDRRITPVIAAAAGTVAVGSYVTVGFAAVGIVAFAVLVVYAGYALPFRSVGVKRDLSYGIYLYGFPTQQVLVLLGVNAWWVGFDFAATVAVTSVLAAASWYLVERPALSLKSVWTRRSTPRRVPVRL